jgi:uncharacterized protein (TIGR00255 family)
MTAAQSVLSMTGYAQTEGQTGPYSWRVELKSVNSKGFDLRVRVPFGFEAIEQIARSALALVVKRGAVQLGVTVETGKDAGSVRINRPLLDEVLKIAKELGEQNIKLDSLLNVRGVIETDTVTLELTPELQKALEHAIAQTTDKLVAARGAEGSQLARVLGEHLDSIASLTAQAKTLAAEQPVKLRDKLTARLTELGEIGLTAERIAGEAALLASRADITEELNRLEGHIKAVRELIKAGGPIGRKLDFMCQELNREANTLCSKSESLALTNVGVELKVIIEQFREQVQNVE